MFFHLVIISFKACSFFFQNLSIGIKILGENNFLNFYELKSVDDGISKVLNSFMASFGSGLNAVKVA